MTLSFAQKCLYPHQGFLCAFFLLLLKAFVELKVGRKTKAYLFQIFCKVKDPTQRVSKSYNQDREVHVCGYVVDEVESKKDKLFHDFVSPFLYFWVWLISLFLHGPSCVHFFYRPSCALIFFQYIAHAFIGENFGERLHGVWNIIGV